MKCHSTNSFLRFLFRGITLESTDTPLSLMRWLWVLLAFGETTDIGTNYGKSQATRGTVYSTALDGAHAAADRRALLCQTNQFSFPTGETAGRKNKQWTKTSQQHRREAIWIKQRRGEPRARPLLFAFWGRAGERSSTGGVWGAGTRLGSARNGRMKGGDSPQQPCYVNSEGWRSRNYSLARPAAAGSAPPCSATTRTRPSGAGWPWWPPEPAHPPSLPYPPLQPRARSAPHRRALGPGPAPQRARGKAPGTGRRRPPAAAMPPDPPAAARPASAMCSARRPAPPGPAGRSSKVPAPCRLPTQGKGAEKAESLSISPNSWEVTPRTRLTPPQKPMVGVVRCVSALWCSPSQTAASVFPRLSPGSLGCDRKCLSVMKT